MTKKILSMAIMIMMVFTAVPFVNGASPDSDVYAASTGTKLAAITFDDGPSGYTSQLLDGLKARDAHATFFMTAKNGSHGILNHSDVLSRMINEGHQLANHSYDHPSIGKLSGSQVANEFGNVEALLFNAQGGSYLDMLRTPGGAVNSTIQANCGGPIILWSVDTLDWKNRNADTVYSNIVNKTGDGSIILLHDLYQTSVQGALRAIDTLQARGYEFVTVAELMRRRGVTPENGKTYTSIPSSGADLPAYSAPVLVPQAGASQGTFSVSAYTAEPGLTFHYTTDGTMPSMASPVLNGPVEISGGTTIKVTGIDRYGTRTPAASASYTYTKYGQLFSDVPADAWYYDTVGEIAHSGLMGGTGSYTFSPDGTLTRGMMVTVLYRYDKSRRSEDQISDTPATEEKNDPDPVEMTDQDPEITPPEDDDAVSEDDDFRQDEMTPLNGETENTVKKSDIDLTEAKPVFEDVSPDAWYYDAVCWAAENGISRGTDDTHFSPDQPVTREQIACMIYNYVKPADSPDEVQSSFFDWYMVSDWSKQSVLWCIDKGILGGNDQGQLQPDANATRAQCAAMLLRLNKAVSKIS